MERVLFSWSGGKDSAMALQELRADSEYEVVALLTTVTEDFDRVSMHGVRRALLQQQAQCLGLPLAELRLPKEVSNATYEESMSSILSRYKDDGVTGVAFGDISLEDLRAHRERNLARLEMQAIFPLWNRDPYSLLRSLIAGGFQAVTTCVDGKVLGREFVGRNIDDAFISDLPAGVDVCGENGEYHSFVHSGPIFNEPIAHRRGEVVLRDDRFWYCDLIPG